MEQSAEIFLAQFLFLRTASQSGAVAAAGWYTYFLDSSGNYIGGSMYEDDDNELTILKGNAKVTSGTITSNATLSMDIAGTCTGFTAASALNGTATCSLSANSQTYTVNFTRLL